MDRLLRYFTEGVADCASVDVAGAEIETSFVNSEGRPITLAQSQALFKDLQKSGWRVAGCKTMVERESGMDRCGHWEVEHKSELVTELVDREGNKVLYELGRQNIELATIPSSVREIVVRVREKLSEIYRSGERVGAIPRFTPTIETSEDLLIIPDERDVTWLRIDGKQALELLARTSAVQFTVNIAPHDAVPALNRLGAAIGSFLRDYPQEAYWRRYIRESRAGYDPLRYGGPLAFADIADYCRKLAQHAVVGSDGLTPFVSAANLDIPLFLRSIWWYFRLKRYGSQLCIEVRPLARRTDEKIADQLGLILGILR